MGRVLAGRGGARLAFVDSALRAAVLGLIACLALAGLLGPAGYVALLGVSSLLSAWGVAGKYTLIADLLPGEHRVAGNTVFFTPHLGKLTYGTAYYVAIPTNAITGAKFFASAAP